MNQLFVTVALPEKSPLQRLFRQNNQNNAIIELNNLLAQKSVESITLEEVQHIAKKHQVNLQKSFPDNLKEFYSVACYHILRRNALDGKREKQLNWLQHILGLTDNETSAIHHLLATYLFKTQVRANIQNGRLDAQKNHQLALWQRGLQLHETEAGTILSNTCKEFVQAFLKKAIEDQRLSPDEDQEFQAMASSFNIQINIGAETLRKLDTYRHYWQIEHGNLPAIQANINLPKTEQCYFQVSTQWFEQRTITQRINYGGVSARVKIMKGVYYRTGSISSHSVSREEWRLLDQGTLYLTNKRIIFMGDKGNKNIRLNKVLSFSPYSNGVEIDKDSGRSPMLQLTRDTELFCLLLSRLLSEC